MFFKFVKQEGRLIPEVLKWELQGNILKTWKRAQELNQSSTSSWFCLLGLQVRIWSLRAAEKILGNHWTRWPLALPQFMNTVQGQNYAILKISSNTYSRTIKYRLIFMAQVDEGASTTVQPWPECLSNQHCFAAAIAYRLHQRGDQRKKQRKGEDLIFFTI